MDQRKLIIIVRGYEALYVLSHPRYCDTFFKDNIWKTIAKELDEPAPVCKRAWSNLRDSFRRALRKQREVKFRNPSAKIKKWRFEDEMSFLLPYFQDACNNWKDASDDDNEKEPNEDKYNDTNDSRAESQNDRLDDRSNGGGDNRNDNEDDDKYDDVDEVLHIEGEKKKVDRKIINGAKNTIKRCQTQPETASPEMKKYLLDEKTITLSNAVDSFFSSIASTVKTFTPYYQNIAKSQIFTIVSDLEMKQIMEEHPFLPEEYHTGSYNSLQHLPSPLSLPHLSE